MLGGGDCTGVARVAVADPSGVGVEEGVLREVGGGAGSAVAVAVAFGGRVAPASATVAAHKALLFVRRSSSRGVDDSHSSKRPQNQQQHSHLVVTHLMLFFVLRSDESPISRFNGKCATLRALSRWQNHVRD
jgi:hypothetical protein